MSNDEKVELSEIRKLIQAAGLSNLCVPREIKQVDEIPLLGTGKVNHRALQDGVVKGDEGAV